jgi:hypothetical protein
MSDSLSNALRGGSVLDRLANPTVVNPLAAYSNALQTANSVWQNRAQQAAQLSGQAYQGAIDAQGNFDPVKYRQNLAAAGPDAALAAGAGVTNAQALQGAQIDQAGRLRNLVASELAPLADPNLTPDQVHTGLVNAATRLIAAGAPTQQVLSYALNAPTDPAARLQWLNQVRLSVAPPGQVQENLYGTPGTMMTPGGVTVGTSLSPRGVLTAPPGQGVQGGLTPAEMAQPVRWQDKDGVVHDTTWAEYAQARGLGNVATPATVNGQPWQPGGAQQARPGPANPPRLNPQTPAGATQTPAGATPQLTDTTGPAPGTVQTAEASAKAYAEDNAAAGSYNDRVFPLAQAYNLLKDSTTGPGTEAINQMKSFLQARAATFGWQPSEIGGVGKFEELNKYMTQYVNKMGSGSDARLASALSGNPSAHISTLANRDVISAMIGMERMRQAAITDFNNQNLPPSQWSSFLRSWQTSHDPRAFVVDMLPADKQQKMLTSMTPTERAAFGRTLDFIADNGAIMNLPTMPH